MRHFIAGLFIVLVVAVSCKKEETYPLSSSVDRTGYWLVPFEEILYWGRPLDRIQSLDDPHFEAVSESKWNMDDRMLVVFANGHIKAYPISVLEQHEIVNDRAGGDYFAVTYCPITGSGTGWNRTINGTVTEFGVSGMLYRENLIPYDRNTGSFWSQMLMMSIHGPNIESIAQPVFLFETDFELLHNYYPMAEILVDTAEYSCSDSICGTHIARGNLKSAGSEQGDILPGDYYFGIVHRNGAVLFGMDMFEPGTQVYTFAFRGLPVTVAGNIALNFIVAFKHNGNSGMNLVPLQDSFPLIMEDDEGNIYDVFGQVVSGPGEGTALSAGPGYRAKGFAWQGLFESAELYDKK
jgi:hypothetical protein